MTKRYRIVNPIRFFIFVMVVVMTISFTIFSIFGASTEAASSNTYRQVIVHQNETLWTIAEENCDPRIDTRDLVAEICEINDVEPNELQPGDTVIVPVVA